MEIQNADPLMNLKESADYLRLDNPKTLTVWKCRKKFTDLLKPTFIGSKIFYRKSVLDTFITARTVK